MSFFKKIFGSQASNPEPVNKVWNVIQSFDDYQKALDASFQKPVVIFKHSTRCFISKSVLTSFEKQISETNKDFAFYYLDILAHRDISNIIAQDLKIEHQSPQIIVIKNGLAQYHASHHHINLEDISE